MKKVAIIQSNYLPWKGYFDIINDVDLFIFYDDVQYTIRDWRNRNKIKTLHGTSWLTIPIGSKVEKLICEIRIEDDYWQRKHWASIEHSYAKSAYFRNYRALFEHVYLEMKWQNLSELNQYLIKVIARDFLNIKTEFKDSREYKAEGKKLIRLMDLLKQAGADIYISGPAARNYIDENVFAESDIQLFYKDYGSYPEYPQFYPPFAHDVSIIDLLFHTGPEAARYIWGWRK